MTEKVKKRFSCLHVLGIMFIAVLLTALMTAWWIKSNIYANKFKPVQLSKKEQQVFEGKLDLLEKSAMKTENMIPRKEEIKGLDEPEPYIESDDMREIKFSEKELNALIAKDDEAAKRVAIDLSRDLISIKLLIPMDEDVPVLGGKTLRLSCGITLSFEDGKPVVVIRGVSLGGIPLPGAWWGDIKNKNLVQEFGSEGGFWDHFSKGVENIKVKDGHFLIKLKK